MRNLVRHDVQKRSLASLKKASHKKIPGKLKRPPRMIEPKSQIREYTRALKAIVAHMEKTFEHVFLPLLPHLVAAAAALRPEVRKDSWSSDLAGLITTLKGAFARDFTEDELFRVALKAGMSASDLNEKNVVNVFQKVLGVNPTLEQPYLAEQLKSFASLNVGLIKSIPDKFSGELEQITYKGLMNGTRYEDLAEQIADRFGVADSRAALIARDQISKLTSQLNELRQNEVGITSYIWRTSLDERVRESHAEKEGNEYRWDDPPSDTGNPGDDINCRCYGEPVMEQADDADEDDGIGLATVASLAAGALLSGRGSAEDDEEDDE